MTALRAELADEEHNGLPEEFKGMIEEVFDRVEDLESNRIDPIEYNRCDGFIPYTNGGFDGVAYLGLRSCGHNWQSVSKYVEDDYKDMLEEFMGDQRSNTSPEEFAKYADMDPATFWEAFEAETFRCTETTDLFTGELAWRFLGPAQEAWREEWECDEDTYFFVKVRAIRRNVGARWNTTGEDEVEFFAFVNTDFEYGRDGSDVHEWSKTVALAECTAEKLAEIRDEIIAHLADG